MIKKVDKLERYIGEEQAASKALTMNDIRGNDDED